MMLTRFLWAALAVFSALLMNTVHGFSTSKLLQSKSTTYITKSPTRRICVPQFGGPLQMASLKDNDDEADRLAKLGYSEDEIRRSRKPSDKPKVTVNVNVVDDVDPFTLTALGFGLIALNFFVFANLGDGGISGIVATVINTMRQ